MFPVSYGGLQIAGNSTAAIAPGTAAKYTEGWAAHGVSQRGDTGVVASAANSRLTLDQGVWKIEITLTVETEDISGTSGDDAGVIAFLLYKGGSAVSGAKATIDAQDSDRPQSVTILDIVEVTKANVDDSANYVELYVDATDASGNDITVSDAKFLAFKLS